MLIKITISGCLTCRKRKIKCDETRPVCKKCSIQRFSCDWAPSGSPASAESHSQIPASRHSRILTPIRYSLQDSQFECANSMVLTAHDRRCLAYFEFSTVHSLYSFGRWDTLQYVVQEVAASSCGVMRMIIALSGQSFQFLIASRLSKTLRLVEGALSSHPVSTMSSRAYILTYNVSHSSKRDI